MTSIDPRLDPLGVAAALLEAAKTDHILENSEFEAIFRERILPEIDGVGMLGLVQFIRESSQYLRGMMDYQIYGHLTGYAGKDGTVSSLYNDYLKDRLTPQNKNMIEEAFGAEYTGARLFWERIKPLIDDDGVLTRDDFEGIKSDLLIDDDVEFKIGGLAALGFSLFYMRHFYFDGQEKITNKMDAPLKRLLQSGIYATALDQTLLQEIELPYDRAVAQLLSDSSQEIKEIDKLLADNSRVDQITEMVAAYGRLTNTLRATASNENLSLAQRRETQNLLSGIAIKLGHFFNERLWQYGRAIEHYREAESIAQEAHFTKGVSEAQSGLISAHQRRIRYGIWDNDRMAARAEALADLERLQKEGEKKTIRAQAAQVLKEIQTIRLACEVDESRPATEIVPEALQKRVEDWTQTEGAFYRTIYKFQEQAHVAGRLSVSFVLPSREEKTQLRPNFIVRFESDDASLEADIIAAFEEEVTLSLRQIEFSDGASFTEEGDRFQFEFTIEDPGFASLVVEDDSEEVLLANAEATFEDLMARASSVTGAYGAIQRLHALAESLAELPAGERRDFVLLRAYLVVANLYRGVREYFKAEEFFQKAALLALPDLAFFEMHELLAFKSAFDGFAQVAFKDQLTVQDHLALKIQDALRRAGSTAPSASHRRNLNELLRLVRGWISTNPPQAEICSKTGPQIERALAVFRQVFWLKGVHFELSEKFPEMSGTVLIKVNAPSSGAAETDLSTEVLMDPHDKLEGISPMDVLGVITRIRNALVILTPEKRFEVEAQARFGRIEGQFEGLNPRDVQAFMDVRAGKVARDCYFTLPVRFKGKNSE